MCWAEVCFAHLPTLVVCHCSELLSLPGVCSAASNKVGTSVHIHQLSQTLPELLCHFQCCPITSFPQQGWELSFLYCFWPNGKRNWAWPPRSQKTSDLWGTAFLMSHLCFSVPSQGTHGRAEASNVMVFPEIQEGGPIALNQWDRR